jgi:hypothetical protein
MINDLGILGTAEDIIQWLVNLVISMMMQFVNAVM